MGETYERDGYCAHRGYRIVHRAVLRLVRDLGVALGALQLDLVVYGAPCVRITPSNLTRTIARCPLCKRNIDQTMLGRSPNRGNAPSRTCTDVGVYLYGIAVAVERLGFHGYVGKGNRLLHPVVGLRFRPHVGRVVAQSG